MTLSSPTNRYSLRRLCEYTNNHKMLSTQAQKTICEMTLKKDEDSGFTFAYCVIKWYVNDKWSFRSETYSPENPFTLEERRTTNNNSINGLIKNFLKLLGTSRAFCIPNLKIDHFFPSAKLLIDDGEQITDQFHKIHSLLFHDIKVRTNFEDSLPRPCFFALCT